MRTERRLGIGIMLIALALFVNDFFVTQRTRAALSRDGGSVIATDVVPVNVRIEGDGPPLVLIHGFGAALDWWDAIVPDLATDHRVIRLDLIGHGGTDAPARGYSIERQAALIAALLDQQGIDRATVIGHSMGGEVATALTAARPDRVERLVLIDTPPSPGLTLNPLSEVYQSPVIGPLLSHFDTEGLLRRGLAQGFAPGFSVPDKFVADLQHLPYQAGIAAHRSSIAFRTTKSVDQRLAALSAVPPLLVIFGALDAIVPAEKAEQYKNVPGARVVVLEGVGHSPMVEAPDKTLDLIRPFVRDAEPLQ
jgi:pimeloyl-ACP methyl ester carboxylesterase